MAKTRKKARKTGAATRAKATKKTAVRRKTAAKRAKPQTAARGIPSDVLDLKRLRREIDLAVAAIARRVSVTGQPSAKLDETQTLLSRWASDIDNICDPDEVDGPCGPTMLIEL